jgi:uncharacterized membrane protein YqjE
MAQQVGGGVSGITPPPVSSVPRPAAVSSVPPASLAPASSEPPLKDVLVELWENTEKLLRQELALASAELDLKAKKLKLELMASAVAVGMALAGALSLVAALILLLSEAMEPWLAALLTSVVLLGAGFGLIKKNRPSVADITPERTLQSLKKDVQTFTEASK